MNSVGLRHFSLVGRIVIRMASSNSSYEDAIRKLNSLQSNKSTIEQIKKGLKIGQKCTNLEDMEKYLLRVGIPLSKLDELSVIHVAGTKGKGSTSAMCESILRRHGYSTGFYSSPHLVSVRERFRLDGWPLSREEFALHLHRVYELLWDSQEFEGDMPKYFAFLTVVAFHVFLQRRVDVAVVEVGIGGIVDYTNILRKVPVVGITALGLDHTSILGNTLPEIAAAKAGIMKCGCDAYTVRQPADALAVLAEYADYVKCPLTVVPDYSSYTFPEADKSYLPVDLDAYRTNASLAIQLAHAWMRARQTNNVQRSIDGHVIKSKNGLGSDILNGTQNAMKKEQNGMKEVVNGLTNGDENLVCNDINEFQHKITNGINMIQNGISNSIVLNDTKHDSVISQDNVAHSRHKYHNDLQDNVTIGMQNGTISIQNDTNRIQNGTISIQHDANTIQNSTNSIQNGINGTQNCINGLRNGIQNETILIQNDLNGIQNGTIAIQNNLNGIQNATIAIQNDTNGKQNATVDKVKNGNAISKLVLEVPYETAEGLKRCKWPGRYHVLDSDFARFYIDGAHTKESVEICAQWFSDTCSSSNKILLFSTTGDRNVEALLKPLSTIPFRQVYFVQPTAYEKSATDHDNYSVVERHELSERCMKHARAWHEYNPATKISVLECVADALISIKAKGDVPSVLVTGSLYLVGAALSILDPNLNT